MSMISKPAVNAQQKVLTLGLEGFARISAVEGITLTQESHRMFAAFERDGLSSEQRRAAITSKHRRKA